MGKKQLIAIILFLTFITSPRHVKAIYDPLSVPNNRIGIHILETAEIDKAANLVNSNGGDWGYVTIPIRSNDRDLSKWTKFMQDCLKLHIIPILRIASFPVDDRWMAPNEYDLIDFANFLDELPWPTRNRYVIVYNEPNHKNEWGGFVYPEEYAQVLNRAIDIFHKTNKDFFIISAGFDSSAPDSSDSMNEYSYLETINNTVPGIFKRVDGFSSHSYGNPGFSTFPSIYSSVSITNYRFEQKYLSTLGAESLKIFITESGWRSDLIGDYDAAKFFNHAFTKFWTDENIVAITPFVLNAASGPFAPFSLLDQNSNLKPQGQTIKNLSKIAGKPELSSDQQNAQGQKGVDQTLSDSPDKNVIMTLFQKILSLFHF